MNTDQDIIEQWLYGKGDKTQDLYRRVVDTFLKAVSKPLEDITLSDLQAYFRTLDVAKSTKATHVNIIRSLFAFASDEGHISHNVARKVKPPRARDQLAQRILSEEQVEHMICSAVSARDHALVRLLYHAGLRVAEVVGLTWKDIHKTKEGATLDIWGKGEKERYIPISASMYQELMSLPGERSGCVFKSRQANCLTTRQVENIVKETAKRAGIEGAVSPHWMRHSNASHALDNGAPIHVVQQTLGHSSLNTTSRYAHIKPGAGSSQYLKD